MAYNRLNTSDCEPRVQKINVAVHYLGSSLRRPQSPTHAPLHSSVNTEATVSPEACASRRKSDRNDNDGETVLFRFRQPHTLSIPQKVIPFNEESAIALFRIIRFRIGASSPESQPPKERKPSRLESGGTLTDEKALGKDVGSAALRKASGKEAGDVLQIVDGEFKDFRWTDGRWDFNTFKDQSGTVDWDGVIDAEIARRQLLEESPIASITDAVRFDTSEIPWWAWIKRFHLPVAEKLNGRAAMLGYLLAIVGEQFSGATLLEQQNSILGKILLHVAVFAVLLIQEFGDVGKYKNLVEEAFFYDRQWAASWIGKQRPSENEDK